MSISTNYAKSRTRNGHGKYSSVLGTTSTHYVAHGESTQHVFQGVIVVVGPAGVRSVAVLRLGFDRVLAMAPIADVDSVRKLATAESVSWTPAVLSTVLIVSIVVSSFLTVQLCGCLGKKHKEQEEVVPPPTEEGEEENGEEADADESGKKGTVKKKGGKKGKLFFRKVY